MLNDTVDFLSDNIDCAIRVGRRWIQQRYPYCWRNAALRSGTSPELLAKYPPLTSLEALSGLPWIAIITFISMRYGSGIRQAGRFVSTATPAPCLSTDSLYVARNRAGGLVAMVSSWTVVEILPPDG